LHQIVKNKKILFFLIALQEAFISIIPFFVLTGIITLLNVFIQQHNITFLFITPKYFKEFTLTIQSYTSIIPTIAIAYFLAKRIKTSEIIAILLSVTTYITIVFYETQKFPLELPYGFTAATIFAPIASTVFLKALYPYFTLNIELKDAKNYLYRLFNYMIVFFVAYFVIMIVYILIDYVMDYLIEEYNPLEMDLPGIITLTIRNILVQIFWFFGMHGEHMVNALFGKNILFKEVFPNLSFGEFQRIFISIGGAGAGVAILLALIITARDKTIKKITYISSPFTIFNIDNILIFLAVVFNRFMFVPFILVPLINLSLSYMFINISHIQFNTNPIIWTTPVFIDSYLKTNSFITPMFQVFLIIVDTTIYAYYLKKFFLEQSLSTQSAILEHNLEIETEVKAKSDIKAFQANQELIEANAKVMELVEDLNKDKLFIYYQPKVDIKNQKVDKFEALIRYQKTPTTITGPYFLDLLEKAGLAPIIDIWVCKQVKKDIQKFHTLNCYPTISINLHPDTLKSYDAVSKIIEILKNEKIIFEIVERSFVDKQAVANIKRIQKNGFDISIDDYGVGYSSLETLIKYDIKELKLDKSLIDTIETKKGFLICAHTVYLCKELNISVVAEGVERNSQLEIIKDLDIDLVQGFIFAPALPLEKAVNFAKNFS